MTKTSLLRRKKLTGLKARNAFSLIELLVVIAVIGIIAAIAIPNIGNLTAGAGDAKDKRNAQNMSSVFSAARAAGLTNAYADKTAAVNALTNGITVGAGASAPTFQVPNVSTTDRDTALGYLDYTAAGQLIYKQTTN